MRDKLDLALNRMFGPEQATFRPGQREAITAILDERAKVLLVQATGWGKSLVYFLSTRLLRDAGAGPTLIISPLLALMADQRRAAGRLGLVAETVNSSNPADWSRVGNQLSRDRVDVLLVSPERLANERFMAEFLMPVAARIGMLVVDEAHCISDWGHDFRPDYQRISRIIQGLPRNISVLATTATANQRVTDDVIRQLGPSARLMRGPLERKSLRLYATRLPSRAARLAWLAEWLPRLRGSGIVYALTVRDCEEIASELQENGIVAQAYHGQLPDEERARLEESLRYDRVKTLVATSALGMGFDKPDLAFVVHFQAPASVVHYYQQVGRAGRAIDEARGILFLGAEDERVNSFFREAAHPRPDEVEAVLSAIAAGNGLRTKDLHSLVNLPSRRIEQVLRVAQVAENGPVVRVEGRWYRTIHPWRLDATRVAALKCQREEEWRQMERYVDTSQCRMQFLADALDDPSAAPCGRCHVCRGQPSTLPEPKPVLVTEFEARLKARPIVISPRLKWGDGATIPVQQRSLEGRALCRWGAGHWSELAADGKKRGRFDAALVEAAAKFLREQWRPQPPFAWVTWVPSTRPESPVPDFAQRLASRLGIPAHSTLVKRSGTAAQKSMRNSRLQWENLRSAFTMQSDKMPSGAVLLMDDMVDSRWTFTMAAALLRRGGAGPVLPFALCDTSART